MTKSFAAIFLVLFLCGLRAAPLTHDLGQGLTYHRAHALPADLPSSDAPHSTGLVLDLRSTTGDSAAATALSAWLKFHSAPRSPVFVLVNSVTSSALLAALSRRQHAIGLVVLAAAAPGFTPDIAVAVPPETDRRAYDALEAGTPLDALLNAPIDKPRNDEAKLARERQPDRAPAVPETPAPSDGASASTPPDPAKPAAPPPLLDAVLQRAVHLHRTLLALKKI